MSKHLRRLTSPCAAMVAILIMGMATPARAALDIWASTTNTTPVAGDQIATAGSGSTATFSGNVGSFSINLLATSSDSPGSPTFAKLTGTTLSITNSGGSTANLYISLGDTGFTGPLTPPDIGVNSHIGVTTVIDNAANTMTFTSYVNNGPAGAQNGTSGTAVGPTSPQILTGSDHKDAYATLTSLSSGFSITQLLAITLGAGSEINFSTNTTLSSVPEPSTMALAGLGMLGFVGYGLRRRTVRSA